MTHLNIIRCAVSGIKIGTKDSLPEWAGESNEIIDAAERLHSMRHPALLRAKGDYKTLPRWVQYAVLINSVFHSNKATDLFELTKARDAKEKVGAWLELEQDSVFEDFEQHLLFEELFEATKMFGISQLWRYTYSGKMLGVDAMRKRLRDAQEKLILSRSAWNDPVGWTRNANIIIREDKPKPPPSEAEKQVAKERVRVRAERLKARVAATRAVQQAEKAAGGFDWASLQAKMGG